MVVGRKIIFSNAMRIAQLLLALFLLEKILFYILYTLKFTDHDQVTVWMMAADYSRGKFEQLYFYGQQYNVAFDAWLAAPLVWLGFSASIAPGFVVFCFSLISIVAAWYYFFSHRKYFAASLCVLIFLCAPFTLHYLWSGGIALGVMLVLLAALFWQYNPTKARLFLGLFVCTIIGFGLKNALPFTLWFCIYSALKMDFKKIWLAWIMGISLGLLFYYFVFYSSVSTQNNLHVDIINAFKFSDLKLALAHFADLFWGLGPLIDYAGIIYFIFILAIQFFIYKNNKALFYANAAYLLVTLFMLGLEKTADGHLNAYFPYLRFFLSIIPIIIFNLDFFENGAHTKRWNPILFALGVIGFTVFFLEFNKTQLTHKHRNISTGITQTSAIIQRVNKLELRNLWANAALVISEDDAGLMYAAQAFFKTANTLYLPYDRRPQKYQAFYFNQVQNIYLVNSRITHNDTIIANYTLRRVNNTMPAVYAIMGNGLTGGEFLKKTGWQYFLKLD
jgi:hypothetical protein